MATKIMRHLVSKKKRRFEWGEFDLDLTYITDRVVAMGFPSENIEGLYRNNMKDVQKFFDSLHPGKYRIYNLCSERKYDHAKFNGNVAEFPFDDHGPPNLDVIEKFCIDASNWLDAHPENVIGVHCKAGKGRTGTLVSCYLLYSGYCKSASEACRLFGNKRTINGKGITIPRYVRYFEQMLIQSPPPPQPLVLPVTTTLVLASIRMFGVPNFNIGGGCEPFLGISQFNKAVYSSKPLKIKKGTEIVEFDCGETLLSRDVKIQFFNKTSKAKMFSLSFHTGYVTGNRLKLRRLELDRANKDTSHKHFAPNFVVELYFKESAKISRQSRIADEAGPPPLKLMFICAACNDFISGEDASIHHMDRNWHWGCLKCSSCQSPLKDDVLFGKDEKPICSACDKTTGFFKFCTACGLLINSHISEEVGEASYHKECFECSDCGRYLGNVSFSTATDKKLICEPCLNKPVEMPRTPTPPPSPPPREPTPPPPPPPPREPTPPPPPRSPTPPPPSPPSPPPPPPPREPTPPPPSPPPVVRVPSPVPILPKKPEPTREKRPSHSRACPSCSNEVHISGDRVIALGALWHKDCFVCAKCRHPFHGGKYSFCETCDSAVRQSYLPSCAGCSGTIADSELTEALGSTWHLDCFACFKCKLPIGGAFAERDGKVYCRPDYEALFCVKCHACSKIIQGSFFRALDKAYHTQCFQCIRCSTPLAGGQYYEIGGRPCCFPCKDSTKFAIPGKSNNPTVHTTKFLCEHRTDSFKQSHKLLSTTAMEEDHTDSPPSSPIPSSPTPTPTTPTPTPTTPTAVGAPTLPQSSFTRARKGVFLTAKPSAARLSPSSDPSVAPRDATVILGGRSSFFSTSPSTPPSASAFSPPASSTPPVSSTSLDSSSTSSVSVAPLGSPTSTSPPQSVPVSSSSSTSFSFSTSPSPSSPPMPPRSSRVLSPSSPSTSPPVPRLLRNSPVIARSNSGNSLSSSLSTSPLPPSSPSGSSPTSPLARTTSFPHFSSSPAPMPPSSPSGPTPPTSSAWTSVSRRSVMGETEQPTWQADEDALSCPLCLKEFTFFYRKHHCRACGRVVCGECSTRKTTLEKLKVFTPTRVCDDCFALFRPHPLSYLSHPHPLAPPRSHPLAPLSPSPSPSLSPSYSHPHPHPHRLKRRSLSMGAIGTSC